MDKKFSTIPLWWCTDLAWALSLSKCPQKIPYLPAGDFDIYCDYRVSPLHSGLKLAPLLRLFQCEQAVALGVEGEEPFPEGVLVRFFVIVDGSDGGIDLVV